MLLQCEMCQANVTEIAKIPCGYYLEKEEDKNWIFIMPNDEEGYRNICIKCLFKL